MSAIDNMIIELAVALMREGITYEFYTDFWRLVVKTHDGRRIYIGARQLDRQYMPICFSMSIMSPHSQFPYIVDLGDLATSSRNPVTKVDKMMVEVRKAIATN